MLEVIIAFGILILGLIPILALLASATQSSKKSTDMINASALVSLVFNERKGEGHWDDLPLTDIVHESYPNYKYTLQLAQEYSSARAARLQIIVRWNSPMGEEILRMQTVIIKRTE